MRLSIKTQRAIARLHFLDPDVSDREISRRLGISANTVGKVRLAVRASHATWRVLAKLSDTAWLNALQTHDRCGGVFREWPNWHRVVRLLESGCPMNEIWTAWNLNQVSPISFPQFCRRLDAWESKLRTRLLSSHREREAALLLHRQSRMASRWNPDTERQGKRPEPPVAWK